MLHWNFMKFGLVLLAFFFLGPGPITICQKLMQINRQSLPPQLARHEKWPFVFFFPSFRPRPCIREKRGWPVSNFCQEGRGNWPTDRRCIKPFNRPYRQYALEKSWGRILKIGDSGGRCYVGQNRSLVILALTNPVLTISPLLFILSDRYLIFFRWGEKLGLGIFLSQVGKTFAVYKLYFSLSLSFSDRWRPWISPPRNNFISGFMHELFSRTHAYKYRGETAGAKKIIFPFKELAGHHANWHKNLFIILPM